MRPASSLEALIPIAMAATLLLPGATALVSFGTLAVLWWLNRRGEGGASWSVIFGVVVVLALLLAEALTLSLGSRPSRIEAQVARSYAAIWQQLETTAERTVERLGRQPLSEDGRLSIFQSLSAEASAAASPATTVLLIDDRGRVFAWGGKGLLHDIESLSPPSEGRYHQASFSAVTLVDFRRLEVEGRSWHVAAGLSLRTETFPFADLEAASPPWTVVADEIQTDESVFRVGVDAGPDLVVGEVLASNRVASAYEPIGWRRLAVLAWALVLLTQAWIGSLGVPTLATSATLAAAVFLVGLAAHSPPWAVLLLAIGAGLGSWNGLRDRFSRPLVMDLAVGITAALAAPTLVRGLQQLGEVPELGSQLWTGSGDLVTRVALTLFVWAMLSTVSRSPEQGSGRSSLFLILSLVVLLAAGAWLDWTPLALVLLVGSGVPIAIWLRGWQPAGPLTRLAVLGIVASLLAATGWELAYRTGQKTTIQESLLPMLAPPTAVEIGALANEMESFLASWDVSSLVPAGFTELARQDLAFEIWRHSPLARYGGLSALRILPGEGGMSSFSFGLPLNEERWVDWSSPLLPTVPIAVWQDAMLVGDGQLLMEGHSWAYAEYALTLQPGFRIRQRYEGSLAEVLLRSGPTQGEMDSRNLGGASFGLFGRDGQPRISPWPQSPALSPNLLVGGQEVVDTPDGQAFAFSAIGIDGVRVLYLPRMSSLEALERVGSHALPALLVLAGLMLISQLPRWARAGFGETWYHLWHSYSRRLVMVYSVLLLVPLGVINFLVVRAFEERLVREQEAAGLRAVGSAQGVLGEYVLALEPGFGIDAALDNEMLHWLASVVHHDVNLYWRGSVYSSSKPEVFTAGLLPSRIPGEIYSGLTLLGHELSMRTNQAGRSEYLELYAPLTVPGISFGQTRVIVSLPMLAQQEETELQIASLRRRSLLGSAAVMMLILALGIRLARRFTEPLTRIVEGTQRIAAGDASLEFRPVELELATLVDAIDDMAQRIHVGRQELLREKRVVDRMVENITAGVISLDEQGRVLMANRVAGEMMGLQVGQELEEVIDQNEQLAPLASVVSGRSNADLTQQTVVLKDSEGEEQEWTVVWVPLPGAGEPSALLVLEDVTEVLRGQRLQAWAEMARMIAHEIKNPLTPIRLSAEHMQEVYESDPENFSRVFESCTTNILTQVGELQEIASDFSTYSRIPKIEPRRGDLLATVEEIVGAYRLSSSNEVRVAFEADRPEILVTFDAKLVGRAVRNLLENAVRAAGRGGRVDVIVEEQESQALIRVADTGPGVEPAQLARIFDPYFSTHDAGTGLGLPIAKQIAEEHGGEITARNRDRGGLEVTLTLPIG